jgi:hypothetical protein
MIKNEIISTGQTIVNELKNLANKSHVKSSQYETLSWEAVGIEKRIEMIKKGELEALIQESKSNLDWGVEILQENSELGERVINFYTSLYEEVNK